MSASNVTLNTKTLFNQAWAMARIASRVHGGNVKQYFGESLKLAYKAAKQQKAEKTALMFILNAFNKKIAFIMSKNSESITNYWIYEIKGSKLDFCGCYSDRKFDIVSFQTFIAEIIHTDIKGLSKIPMLPRFMTYNEYVDLLQNNQ